jgi:hypothetical protein
MWMCGGMAWCGAEARSAHSAAPALCAPRPPAHLSQWPYGLSWRRRRGRGRCRHRPLPGAGTAPCQRRPPTAHLPACAAPRMAATPPWRPRRATWCSRWARTRRRRPRTLPRGAWPARSSAAGAWRGATAGWRCCTSEGGPGDKGGGQAGTGQHVGRGATPHAAGPRRSWYKTRRSVIWRFSPDQPEQPKQVGAGRAGRGGAGQGCGRRPSSHLLNALGGSARRRWCGIATTRTRTPTRGRPCRGARPGAPTCWPPSRPTPPRWRRCGGR